MPKYLTFIWEKDLAADQAAAGAAACVVFIAFQLLMSPNDFDLPRGGTLKMYWLAAVISSIVLSIGVSASFSADATSENQALLHAALWGLFIGLLGFGVKNLYLLSLIKEWTYDRAICETWGGMMCGAACAVVATKVILKRAE